MLDANRDCNLNLRVPREMKESLKLYAKAQDATLSEITVRMLADTIGQWQHREWKEEEQ